MTELNIIATIGSQPLDARATWAIMTDNTFLGLSWCNPKTIEPDWVGFFGGKLLKMVVEPETFYRELSQWVANEPC